MIVVLIQKAFIYLMAKLIQFTPHIKEIHLTDKVFIVHPVWKPLIFQTYCTAKLFFSKPTRSLRDEARHG